MQDETAKAEYMKPPDNAILTVIRRLSWQKRKWWRPYMDSAEYGWQGQFHDAVVWVPEPPKQKPDVAA